MLPLFILTTVLFHATTGFAQNNGSAEEAVNLSTKIGTPPTPTPPSQALKATIEEEPVNLSAPISKPSVTKPKPVPQAAVPPVTATNKPAGMFGRPASSYGRSDSAGSTAFNFKVYFDLNLVSRPGVADLTFDNYHAFLFFEGTPMPEIQFNFDVSSSPRFYELDWQLNPSLQFRAGKIWIPFDDTTPHNIYGGRTNVSKINLGAAFLPDLWTDLGIGLKWTAVDSRNLNLVADAYIVNGFRDGGVDPITTSGKYPVFSDIPTSADNNNDKAFGARIHALLFNRFGLGASGYTARWTDQSEFSKRLTIIGSDLQYKITPRTDIRLGLASMKIDLPNGTVNRAGTYAEIGQYLNPSRSWRLLLRGGTLQLDDRVIDINDQKIAGITLSWRPNIIQFSLEHSRDLQRFSGKVNYSFTNLRMVVMF